MLNKIKEAGSEERKKAVEEKQATVAKSENEELVEELICSQEEHPGTD